MGQEETDEVILRDVHRTYPEHPLFALPRGQEALFRVLKAYSLHDLEVCYMRGEGGRGHASVPTHCTTWRCACLGVVAVWLWLCSRRART